MGKETFIAMVKTDRPTEFAMILPVESEQTIMPASHWASINQALYADTSTAVEDMLKEILNDIKRIKDTVAESNKYNKPLLSIAEVTELFCYEPSKGNMNRRRKILKAYGINEIKMQGQSIRYRTKDILVLLNNIAESTENHAPLIERAKKYKRRDEDK